MPAFEVQVLLPLTQTRESFSVLPRPLSSQPDLVAPRELPSHTLWLLDRLESLLKFSLPYESIAFANSSLPLYTNLWHTHTPTHPQPTQTYIFHKDRQTKFPPPHNSNKNNNHNDKPPFLSSRQLLHPRNTNSSKMPADQSRHPPATPSRMAPRPPQLPHPAQVPHSSQITSVHQVPQVERAPQRASQRTPPPLVEAGLSPSSRVARAPATPLVQSSPSSASNNEPEGSDR